MRFSTRNKTRCESPNGFGHKLDSWSLSDWMTATTGELGEAANIIKKLNRVRDGIPGNTASPEQLRADLADELADVAIYLELMAQAAGFDLEKIRDSKFAKTSAKIGYDDKPKEGHCQLCGLPMLSSETMFFYHGYSESCEEAKSRLEAAKATT